MWILWVWCLFFSALRSTLPIFELVALTGIIIDVVKESAVFTVEPSTSYLTVFGTDPHSDPDFALRTIAKQLLSVCVTLGEDPIIRFQSNDGDPKSPTRFLASMLQKEIDSFCRLNTNFPVGFLQLENLFEKGRSSWHHIYLASSESAPSASNIFDCRPHVGSQRTVAARIYIPSNDQWFASSRGYRERHRHQILVQL